MDEPRRVVICARVSRGERSQDPTTQTSALRALCARQGWIVVGDPVEEKLSAWDGAQAARVQAKALAPIKAGEANTLAVWALDRICRGGIEAAFRFLRSLERDLGAAFVSLEEPFLSTTSDPQMRELMVSLLAWVARWESQRKSERLRAKAVRKRELSAQLGTRATWGVGHLASDAQVDRVRELRSQGHSVRHVADLTGLSKSQVGRIRPVPPQAAGQRDPSDE